VDGLVDERPVWVALDCLAVDRLEHDRVLLQVLRRPGDEVLEVESACGRVSSTVLTRRVRYISRITGSNRAATHLEEDPEVSIVLHLVLHPLLRHRQMPDIPRIRNPELGGCLEEHIPDPIDHRILFSLPYSQALQQASVALSQVKDIVEHVVDETVQVSGDNGRVRLLKGPDEEALDDVKVGDILDFLVDDVIDDGLAVYFTLRKLI
jgi:hypothetical protein